MVDLVEAAKKIRYPSRGCWADELPDDLAAQLAEVRELPDPNITWVHRALREAGVKVGRTSVSRHLRRECPCE